MKLKKSSYQRCSYHILIFFISHLWSGINSDSFPGYSIKAPRHVTVQRGLCVYIPCRFTVPETETLTRNAVGYWINMNGDIVASNKKINNQLSNNGRFSLVGDVRRGDCTLYIEDLLYKDEGHYHFRVEDNIQFTYRDITPHVEVTDIVSKSLPGYCINVPHNVTVQQGLCMYIPCQFTVPKGVTLTTDAVGLWLNTNGVILASNRKRNNQFLSNGRFSLVGDVRRGDCSFYIEDPLHEDEGHYHFRVEDKIKFSYLDIQPYVEVTDLIDKPEISPIKSWVDGEEVTLTCRFPGRCKNKRIKPHISWRVNIQSQRAVTWDTNDEHGTKTHFSKITFTARKEKNNTPLSCIVQLKEGLTTAQQITIKVEYPPRAPEIKCSIVSKEPSNCAMDSDNIIYSFEGSQLSLTCSADSVPRSSLVWKSSNQAQTSSSIDKLTFTELALTDEGFYTCQATNVHGTRETSATIRITYPPRALEIECSIINTDQNILSTSNCTIDANNTIYILEGSQLSLTCSADSVPESSLVWKSSNQKQTSSSRDKLTFTNLALTDEGFYTCQATNTHGTMETSVHIKIIFHLTSKSFPAAAVYGGCFVAVFIVIGFFLIMFYKKRKMMQKKENSRQTNVGIAEPIYGNSEMFPNGPHEVGPIPQKDDQSPPETETVHLNCQDVEYMSVDFSKLKPQAAAEIEEIAYAVVKRKN